jgi:hypothetical protein
MVKNLFFLGLLTWVSISYAKHPVIHESMDDAEAFKIDHAVEEQDAQRSVAGEKIKKSKSRPAAKDDSSNYDPDSGVRYWEYSE